MDYERVLVCGAHPDDEVAMAGTIAKFSEKAVLPDFQPVGHLEGR